MRNLMARCAAIVLLPAMALAAAMPAEARDGYYHRDRGSDDAAVAIGAGVVGLALGAAIASSGRDRDYYYDEGYDYPRGYYARPYPRYYGRPGYRYDYPRHYRRDWRGPGWRGDGWRHERRRHWRY